MLYPGQLPDFPWDSLVPFRQKAASYDGILADMSIGTPVDPTPRIAVDALINAAQSPGYPPTTGTDDLLAAMTRYWARRGATVDAVLPTVGSKEMVALLPSLLGIGEGQNIIIPECAYPTYEVSARLAGATPIPVDPTTDPETWPEARLAWLNSPANPTGHVLHAEQLARIITVLRGRGTIIVADECYAALPWTDPYVTSGIPSLLADGIAGHDHTGLLALYSLSKQSNLAGYRAAMIAGDSHLIHQLTEVRKHAGFMMPGPVQAAMAVVLDDPDHVAAQWEIYHQRRTALLEAVHRAGLVSDPDTAAGLYLWLKKDGYSSWDLVDALAQRGILVAPGEFYGDAGRGYVRMALTASDDAIEAAIERLNEPLK